MNCPLCAHDNLAGAEECEGCGADLRSESYQANVRQGRLHRAVLGELGDVAVIDALRLTPTDTVGAAVDLMRDHRVGSVLVMEEEQLVGIFNERHLISRVDAAADLGDVTLAEVMTREPRTYNRSQSLAHAMNAQALRGHRHLAVVDDDEAVLGFVSVRGILSHIREKTGL